MIETAVFDDVISLNEPEAQRAVRSAACPRADKELSRVTDRLALHQAVAALEPREQLVVMCLAGMSLKPDDFQPEMTVEEIVKEHEIPRSTVYALRNSAYAKLRRLLSEGA